MDGSNIKLQDVIQYVSQISVIVVLVRSGTSNGQAIAHLAWRCGAEWYMIEILR